MVEIIRVHEPGELIALVPRILGFEPQDSIVVLGIDAAGRVCMSARLDRTDCRVPDLVGSLAEATSAEALRTGSTGIVVLEYTEEPVPWGTEASEGLVALCDTWIEVRDVWIVHAGAYWSPGCDDPMCCPPGGRRVPRPSAAGPTCSTRRSPRGGARVYPHADGEDRRRARRARARFAARREGDERAWRAQAWEEWRDALRTGDAPVPRLGRLGAALAIPEVRDAVILTVLAAPESEISSVLAGRPESTLSALEGLMHGDTRPDAPAVPVFADLLLAVSAVSRAPERASALAVLALVWWWQGDPAESARAADEALRCEAGHRLATLIKETSLRGILPGWLRSS